MLIVIVNSLVPFTIFFCFCFSLGVFLTNCHVMPFAQHTNTTIGSFCLIPKRSSGTRSRKNTPEKRSPIPYEVVLLPNNALPTPPAIASRCSTTPSTTTTIRWSASPPERKDSTKTTTVAAAIQCLQLRRNNGPLILRLPRFPMTTRQATAAPTTTPYRLPTADSTTKQNHIFSTASQPPATPAPTAVPPAALLVPAKKHQRTMVALPPIKKRMPCPPARQALTRRLRRGPSTRFQIRIQIHHTRVVTWTSSNRASTRSSSA